MAPVAAQLASGLSIDKVGPQISVHDCLLGGPEPCSVIDNILYGEITHIDRFGNLCTNIKREDVEKFSGGGKIAIRLGGDGPLTIDTFCCSYSGQAEKALLALYDSHGFLEIAENMGSASQRLQSSIGSIVSIFLK